MRTLSDLQYDTVRSRLNVETLLTRFVEWLPQLLSAFAIVVVFWLAWRLARPFLARILSRAGLDHALAGMMLSAMRFTLGIFCLIMAVNQIGINIGAALTGLGVAGLTIGFAAKDSLSNIMAGFLILWDKPFHSGDWVTLGDKYGRVEEITMRTTRLLTWSNTQIIIPNETVINQILVNHSSKERIRIEVPIEISAKENISENRTAIVNAVRDVEGVMDDPAPDVVIQSLNSASIHLLIYAWVEQAEQEFPVQCKILEATRVLLYDNPIENRNSRAKSAVEPFIPMK
jgi:small conductance mechanosensitive channel